MADENPDRRHATAPNVAEVRTLDDRREQHCLALAVDGDHLAFAELLQLHDDRLRALVWRLTGSQNDMDDICQEAYLKAWRSIGTYNPDRGAAFGTWLWRVVHSTCIDHHRRQGRRPQRTSWEIDDIDIPVRDAEARIVLRDELRAALHELPEEQAAVIALADGEGLSYDEIAELVGVKPGTVASRLSRARAALRLLLSNAATSDDATSDHATSDHATNADTLEGGPR